jgi:hypothetical protein
MLPDEALSSWIARIAARYDLSAAELVARLPLEDGSAGMEQRIDYEAVPGLEAALCDAAGKPVAGFQGQRLPGIEANPKAAWHRKRPAWCPVCVSHDVANRAEIYCRRDWGFGGLVMCPRHKCLLISDCPRCLQRPRYRAVAGRLRIWCIYCESFADNMLAANEIPFWPYGTPQQQQSCVPVTLSTEAAPLLLRVQSDLLAMLAGVRPKTPWARSLKHAKISEVLRKLSFVMLGPLWEDAYRPPMVRDAKTKTAAPPEDWTPGSLPPEVAAPTLLASVTFLAAESGTRLEGITWNRELLLDGERETIAADTLTWHLNRPNAALIRDFFAMPLVRPFALLLAVLRADRRGLAAAREAARRHAGVGGARRRRARQARIRAQEDEAARSERMRREAIYCPPDRFALSRFIETTTPHDNLASSTSHLDAAAAVFMMIGAAPDKIDLLVQSDGAPTLLKSRYIRYWIYRHMNCEVSQVISALADAVDFARAHDRDIILPEWPSNGAEKSE